MLKHLYGVKPLVTPVDIFTVTSGQLPGVFFFFFVFFCGDKNDKLDGKLGLVCGDTTGILSQNKMFSVLCLNLCGYAKTYFANLCSGNMVALHRGSSWKQVLDLLVTFVGCV